MRSHGTATAKEVIGELTRLERIKHHRNIRAFIVSATVVICFGVASLPDQLWWFLYTTGVSGETGDFREWLFIISLTGTSAVNPFIYGVFDRTFRSGYQRIWKKMITKVKHNGGKTSHEKLIHV